MIRHLVFLRPQTGTSQATLDAIFADLAGLQDSIPGVSGFAFRPNISSETAVVHGFTWMFWFDFESLAVRDAYLDDPAHRAIGARIVEATGGREGIFVCDIDMESAP